MRLIWAMMSVGLFAAGVIEGRGNVPLESELPWKNPDVQLMIVAGSSNVTPSEAPSSRIDSNTTGSAYAGVGSLHVPVGANSYIGSAAALTPYHVLTAAHVLDIDGDGFADAAPSSVTFVLNYGGSPSHLIAASALHLHPDYHGHATNLNDDIAIVELSSPLPAGVPLYDIVRTSLVYQTAITLVGYGRSGYGDIGFTVGPSYFIKRAGTNFIDGIWSWDDEGTNPVFEVWYGDFDAPDGSVGFVGGASVGNRLETTLGGGDSGGPGFIWHGGVPYVVSVNTFGFTGTAAAPLFGSGLGGIHVPAYARWIDSITGIPEPSVALLALVGGALVAGLRSRKPK